ncbi:hypothetical protein CC80DRAFT_554615 [Byssothecium circinans]|uniref:DUF6604 domain-containing protein n=1 Tax=Byssothecium circinans TaxID=147558 RepID=A0A6A5TBH1_9PLEO|nr:hypothetical protein CC80DRAFT_554615 [Byssothecium circinans]
MAEYTNLHAQYKSDTDTWTTMIHDMCVSLGLQLPEPEEVELSVGSPSTAYTFTTEQILAFARAISEQESTVPMSPQVWNSYKRAVRLRQMFGTRYLFKETKERVTLQDWNGNPASIKDLNGHEYFIWVMMESARLVRDRVVVQSVASLQGSVQVHPSPLPDGQTIFDVLMDLANTEDSAEDLLDLLQPTDVEEVAPRSRRFRAPKILPVEELEAKWSFLAYEAKALVQFVVAKYEANRTGSCDDLTPLFMAEVVTRHVQQGLTSLQSFANEHQLALPVDHHSTGDFFLDTTSYLQTILDEQLRNPNFLMRIPKLKGADQDKKDDFEYLAQCWMDLSVEYGSRARDFDPKGKHSKFPQPLRIQTLDILSQTYHTLADKKVVAFDIVVAADIMRRIRRTEPLETAKPLINTMTTAKNIIDQLDSAGKEYNGMLVINKPKEMCRTIAYWIRDWPLEKVRYIWLRSAAEGTDFYGIHRDYPVPGLKSTHKAYLKELSDNGVQDPIGDRATLDTLHSSIVMPPKDAKFLRLVNPAFRSKLSISLLLNYEDFGIQFANRLQHIFMVAHLYHALAIGGKLTGQWDEMDEIIRLDKSSLFLGEPTTSHDKLLTHFLQSSGWTRKMARGMRQSFRDGQPVAFEQLTKKNLDIDPHPMAAILREYLNEDGKASLDRTVLRLDELVSNPKKSKAYSSILGTRGVLPFLKELEKPGHLPAVANRYNVDYLKTARQCTGLLFEIDRKVGQELFQEGLASKQSWKEGKTSDRDFGLAYGLIARMDLVLEKIPKGMPTATSQTLDKAVEVVRNFLGASEKERESWMV